LKVYEMVIRHEPRTSIESEEGWWYEHVSFQSENDGVALEEARRLCQSVGEECSATCLRSAGYGCDHSVDESYRIEQTGRVSIFNDGVFQSIFFDENGNEKKIKRVTDGTLVNLFRTRLR